MRYTVYLEVQDDGATMVHVPELPGCASTGLTQEVALARTPDVIRAYNAWLRAHGEQAAAESDPIEVVVGGSSQDSDPHLGDQVELLPTDQGAMSAVELAQLTRLLNYSRQDLLDQITGMSREMLHWQPGTSESEQSWCIDDILEHIARAERVFTSRLNANIFAIVEDARREALERMSRLTDQELSAVTEHQGEYWTARKVFRRFLEHEREHTQHIAHIVSEFSAAQGLRPEE